MSRDIFGCCNLGWEGGVVRYQSLIGRGQGSCEPFWMR